MVGVQIGSHVNRWNWELSRPEPAEVWDLDAPELQCVFSAAEELGAAIFVHPWGMDQGSRMSKYWMPFLVGESPTSLLFNSYADQVAKFQGMIISHSATYFIVCVNMV